MKSGSEFRGFLGLHILLLIEPNCGNPNFAGIQFLKLSTKFCQNCAVHCFNFQPKRFKKYKKRNKFKKNPVQNNTPLSHLTETMYIRLTSNMSGVIPKWIPPTHRKGNIKILDKCPGSETHFETNLGESVLNQMM